MAAAEGTAGTRLPHPSGLLTPKHEKHVDKSLKRTGSHPAGLRSRGIAANRTKPPLHKSSSEKVKYKGLVVDTKASKISSAPVPPMSIEQDLAAQFELLSPKTAADQSSVAYELLKDIRKERRREKLMGSQ